MAIITNNVPTVQLSLQDPETLSQVTQIISSSFKDIPITIAIICSLDGRDASSPHDISSERVLQHFEPQLQQIAKAGSTVVQTGDWSVVAIWEVPTHKAMRRTRTSPFLQEFESKVHEVKVKHLSDPTKTKGTGDAAILPLYHLDFLARNPAIASVPGAIRASVIPFLERAHKDQVPVFLEAATLRAAAVYERLGFRTVDEIRVGIGQYGSDGWPSENGEGVCLYAMVYDVHLRLRN